MVIKSQVYKNKSFTRIKMPTHYPNKTILMRLLRIARIPPDVLTGKTLLAPTDQAFRKLPVNVLQFLVKPENREVLTKILTYHVIDPNTSNLAQEAYPESISIDQVLIPPSLRTAVAALINQGSRQGCPGCYLPSNGCSNCYKGGHFSVRNHTNNL